MNTSHVNKTNLYGSELTSPDFTSNYCNYCFQLVYHSIYSKVCIV